MEEHRAFRVRTDVGIDGVINVPLNQTFDTIDILSLKLKQKNAYKLYDCGYGVIVGRVLANDGFGVPNAKISIFIPMEDSDYGHKLEKLYNFSKPNDRGENGYMYNLLPDAIDKECHQNVGAFYGKRVVLDNDDVIEVFDKYYKYTTVTNQAGDYMLYGVPTGSQLLHLDVDLSDIGILSQTPRDMMYKGYTADLFDSPTKFKKDSNLNTLPQIKRQTKSVFVQPFWGDTSDGVTTNASIARCDINIDYKFESTCIFMGSVVTDTGDESINKNCRTTKNAGKMSQLTTGPGMIEMVRYNERGKIEQASVKGEKLIDDNGVWCYQIPMNLDYVKTDEFGKIVPSDDPNKGIATRAKVRFRISMDEVGGDGVARKRARYLVPNNPEIYSDEFINRNPVLFGDLGDSEKVKKSDVFAFGTHTDERDFRNLYWNCVYTVKSYIPRLQKSKNATDRRFTGIKSVNRSGDNNPMPYNSLSGRMNFNYVMLCLLLKLVVRIVYTTNIILSTIAWPALETYKFLQKAAKVLRFIGIGKIFCKCKDNDETTQSQNDDDDDDDPDTDQTCHVCDEGEEPAPGCLCHLFYAIYSAIGCGIGLSGLCEDGKTYYPGCIKSVFNTFSMHNPGADNNTSSLFNCFENKLAEDNEVMNFNFANDWINGVLYFPLWFRFIKEKRVFFIKGIQIKGRDLWCNSDGNYKTRRLKLFKTCSLNRTLNTDKKSLNPLPKEHIPGAIYDEYYDIPNMASAPAIGYNVSGFKENNCYGFKCIRKASSCINGLPGIIAQRTTNLGEYVYYYSPGSLQQVKKYVDAEDEKYEFVKMFSTDIVLLGSLHSCDMQGIPQFFKNLQSTTYNMPPDIVLNDGEEDESYTYGSDSNDNGSEPVFYKPGTEYTFQTGADWGERGYGQCYGPNSNIRKSSEEFSEGGLFYGLTCSNIYTKPKTCVNLERVCEFGVTPDISTFINEENGGQIIEKTLIADGFISYDDLNMNDARTEFARLNSHLLRTRTDERTGFEVYDFDTMYLDNFDGSMKNLMNESKCGCTEANYYYNYKLEDNSPGYSHFRYGEQINLIGFSLGKHDTESNNRHGEKNIPFNNGFISTLNSFYFYFGLKFGKTAIDKFFREYFGVCDVDESEHSKINIDYRVNSVCPGGDGFLAIDIPGIDIPYSISFEASNDVNNDIYVDGIESRAIFFGSCQTCSSEGYTRIMINQVPVFINNDNYHVEIIDANGEVDSFELDFTNDNIVTNISGVQFVQTNNDLYPQSNTPSYNSIAEDQNRYPNDDGGYIVIEPPKNGGTNATISNYNISVSKFSDDDFPAVHGTQTSDTYDGVILTIVNGAPYTNPNWLFHFGNDEIAIGIPKGGCSYIVRVTELCNGNLTTNFYETVVTVNEPEALRMSINDIDYNMIKYFESGQNMNNIKGWLDMAFIGVDFGVLDNGISNLLGSNLFVTAKELLKGYSISSPVSYYDWTDEYKYDMSNLFGGCYVVTTTSELPTQDISEYPNFCYVEQNYTLYKNNATSFVPMSDNEIDYYFTYQMSQEEQQDFIDGLLSIVNKREEFSHKVRSAFYTRSDYGEYDVILGYGGGVPLISHCIKYTSEDNNGNPSQNNVFELNDSAIVGQKSPTITFNNQTPVFYVKNNIKKEAYVVGVNDDINGKLPVGCTFTQTNISNGFPVHIINKPFVCEYEIWAPLSKVPNFFTTNGGYLTCNGIFAIKLKNGISTSHTKEPTFQECKIENGTSDSLIYFETLAQYNTYISVLSNESHSETRRIGYNVQSQQLIKTGQYTIDSACTRTRQYAVLEESFPQATSFICNDGRETININLYPKFKLNIDTQNSYIRRNSNQNGVYLNVIFYASGGYNPSEVYWYLDDTNSPSYYYPIRNNSVFNSGHSIMKWNNLQYIKNSNNNNTCYKGVCSENNGRFTMENGNDIPINDSSLVFAISVSGTQNSRKMKYALSPIIDTTIPYYSSYIHQLNGMTIILTTPNTKYVENYNFTFVGRDSNNDFVIESSTMSFNQSNTYTASGNWLTANSIYIKDILGIQHMVYNAPTT